MPLISVIIPNLNCPVIDQTLWALEAQSFPASDYEIIVVGQDRPGLIRSSPNLRFVTTEQPLLPGAARNRGAVHAHGEILAFTDADCIPAPDWLETIARKFSNPEMQIAGGGVRFSSENFWTAADNLSSFYEHLAHYPPGIRSQLPSLNLALRAELFHQLGGFDPNRPTGEDSDLTIRIRQSGYRLHFIPDAVVEHRPQRHTFIDLLKHSYTHGRFSIKTDPHHPADQLPWPVRTRIGILLAAPFLAAGVLSKMLFHYNLYTYWYLLPAIYLAKLIWCVGAANHPDWYGRT